MHLLHHSPLYDHILLILLKLRCVHEVELVIALVLLNHLVLVHIKRDGEVALQREIRVLDVSAIHFLVFVEQVRVLKFLNGLVND